MHTTKRPTFFELLKQSLQNVEGGYDLLAEKFDASDYITPEAILKPFFERIRQERNDFAQGLDLCCGTGAATKHLAGLCSDSITAVDLSQGMLDKCKERLSVSHPQLKSHFIKANALDLPFDQEFDLVVSFGAFGHILTAEEEQFIRQIHRSLRPGGQFYFITTEALPMTSLSYWRQKSFNAILRIRNFLIKPEFIMYYLTFRLPEVQIKLEKAGFDVSVLEDVTFDQSFNYLIPLKYFKMVKAEKKYH